jgi:hypothetical protein
MVTELKKAFRNSAARSTFVVPLKLRRMNRFEYGNAYAQDGFLSGDSMDYRANENSDEPSRPGHYVPVFTSSGSSLASYADVRIEVAR